MPIYHETDQVLQGGGNNLTTTPTINKPANLTEGNLWVIVLGVRSGSSGVVITPPSGFNTVDYASQGFSYSGDIGIFWKIAGPSEPASVDFTLSNSLRWASISGRATEFDPDNPIGLHSLNVGSQDEINTSIASDSINGTADNLLVAAWAFSETANSLSVPVSEPVEMVKRAEIIRSSSAGINVGLATQDLLATEATGTRLWDWSESGSDGGTSAILLEINAISSRTLTIISDHGTVTKNPDKAEYEDGEVVELTADPDPGWKFDSWSGDISSASNPVNITMNEATCQQ